MTASSLRHVSEPTLRRLPSYHRFLVRYQQQGATTVSCTDIAQELKVYPTQVRKDLAVTGITGRPKVGYGVPELLRAIESFLGWNDHKSAFLAGVGNLGTALLGYGGFEQHGIEIVAGFDTDPNKVNTEVHGKEILAMESLTQLAARMHIHMGIVTVPAAAAQEVADMMVDGGITAIWNFAPVTLRVPDGVVVQNEDLAGSLSVLSKRSQKMLSEQTRLKHG